MNTNACLQGQAAIVTGGRRGIGKAICLRLAAEGCDIAVIDQHDVSDTVNGVTALGRRARAWVIDVANVRDVFATVEEVVESFGRIDILVNNAGIAPMVPFLEMPEATYDRTLAVNLKGVFFFSQAVARHMKQRQYGRIVNINSNAAILGYEELSAYGASKGGGVALTLAMAVELGPFNITVNAIGPGTVKTELAEEYLKGERARIETEATPLRRLGTPEDIAALVAFLASEDASWITGQAIYIDGGYSINGTSNIA